MVNFKRVSKPNARKMYNQGCSILLLPCKVNDSAVNGSKCMGETCDYQS